MTSPAYSIVYSAYVSGVTGVGAAGDVLITNTAGSAFVLATSSNRGARRATGIALEPYTDNSTVEIQQSGQVAASLVPSLGPGATSWVRVSTLGQLERCLPSGSDDVCGWVEADGTFHACFGYLTATIVNGAAMSSLVITQPDWYIDSVAGDDTAAGTIGAPLKTWAGLRAKFGTAPVFQPATGNTVTIHLSGTSVGIGPPSIVGWTAGSLVTFLVIQGTPTVVASGTITAVTARNPATRTPDSFTGTAAVDLAHRVRITSGPNLNQIAWPALDLGGGAARTGAWSTGTFATPGVASVGDAYNVESLTQVYADGLEDLHVARASGGSFALIFRDLQFITNGAETRINVGAKTWFEGCDLGNKFIFKGTDFYGQTSLFNCKSGVTISHNAYVTFTGGLNTGGSYAYSGGLVFTGTAANPLTIQGGLLVTESGGVHCVDGLGIFDGNNSLLLCHGMGAVIRIRGTVYGSSTNGSIAHAGAGVEAGGKLIVDPGASVTVTMTTNGESRDWISRCGTGSTRTGKWPPSSSSVSMVVNETLTGRTYKTTDASTVPLVSYIGDNQIGGSWTVRAWSSDGSGTQLAAWSITAEAGYPGALAFESGSPTVTQLYNTGAVPAPTATLRSGIYLDINATGIAATNINWSIVEVGSPSAAASTTVTGTGFWHNSAGSLDPAATGLTWTGDATGTGTGTSFVLTVVKVNGATYPAAGALVTGTVPRVTGASAVAYGALDLANASAVTGTLPSGNAPSHSGDVTGAHSATVVAKINGATVPAAGALTTGHVLQVSGASANTYGFVADANVAAAAAVAGTKISPNFGAQDVTTTGNLSVGTTPATTGVGVRVPAGGGVFAKGAADLPLVTESSGIVCVGGVAGVPNVRVCATTYVQNRGNSGVYNGDVAGNFWSITTSTYHGSCVPLLGGNGSTLNPSAYSVHGRMPVRALAAATTYTVVGSEYCFQVLQFSSTTASACTITLPDAPNEAGCYFKDIDVTQCNVSQVVTFTAGAGTRTAAITGGGAGAPGVPKRIFVSPGCVDLAPG